MASINTNISAFYAQNNLRAAGDKSQTSIARLSSGNKIVRASDDVAALSVGTILRTDVSTLKTALVNANQGSTLLQIADGALARVGEILQRQKALATQSNSGTLSATEKGYLNQEFQSLKSELDRIVSRTNFNGVTLIDGNLVSGGSIVTQETATMTSNFAELTNTNDSIDSAIFDNGVDAVKLSSNGTADNSTLNKLFGSLAEASVSVVGISGGTTATMSVTINGVTFASASGALDLNADTTVTLTANDGSGVAITIDVDDQDATSGAITTDAATAEDNIQEELRKLSLYQAKAISATATDAGSIVAATTAGGVLDGLTGSSIVIRGKGGFGLDPAATSTTTVKATAPSISNFNITSHSATKATFSVEVDGVTYTARQVTVDSALAGQAFGTDIDGYATNGGGNGKVRLLNLDDKESYIEIDFTGLSVGVESQDEADRVAAEFNRILGSGSSGGLDFQVGTDSEDKIGITLGSVSSTALYKKTDGTAVTMDLVTGDIGDISGALDNAIKTVTSRRADVGAMQSRFSYAASALEVSIQNLDAARGQFLDADISEESTAFATAQVLQQASISVLAQANQIPQNLLKLIG